MIKRFLLLVIPVILSYAPGQTLKGQGSAESSLLKKIELNTKCSVDPASALEVARAWFKANDPSFTATDSLTIAFGIRDDDSLTLVYVVAGTNYRGFAIVAGDKRGAPVLGFSAGSGIRSFATGGGDHVQEWIGMYAKQIKSAKDSLLPAMQDKWDNALAGNFQTDNPTTVVNPLLTTNWGQGFPYNAYCPADPGGPGGHVWAGCVAVALAQIMRYHQYPQHGIGSYCYQWASYPQTCANFGGANYNWANMPNSVSSLNPDVATIVYHNAVSVKSQWGAGQTGVTYSTSHPPMKYILWNYFGYAYDSLEYLQKQNYTSTQWDGILQAELVSGRPVYYRGDGTISHAWVCDGVNSSNMYHFNFGWDGAYNGYYLLTAITPGGNNMTNNQHCIIGIKPNDGSTLLTNTTWSGTVIRTKSLAIPDSLTLTLAAGTTVKLGPGREIYAGGRFNCDGNQNNRVVVTSIDTTLGNRRNAITFDNYFNRMQDNDTSFIRYADIKYSKQHGIFCDSYGKVHLSNCIISNNDAGIWNGTSGQTNGYGGGVFSRGMPIIIDSCRIDSNHAMQGGGLYMANTGTIFGKISRTEINNNVADASGGGFCLVDVWNVDVSHSYIHHNQSPVGAGGKVTGGSPNVSNSRFSYNTTLTSSGKGAAMYMENVSTGTRIANNLVDNNTARSASAFYFLSCSPRVLCNTITANNATNVGTLLMGPQNNPSSPLLKNNIIWGNPSANGGQIWLEPNCQPIFNHNDNQGGIGSITGPGASGYNTANYNGQGNKDTIPGFVNAAGGDYHLVANSTLNNYGDTTGVSQYIPLQDLDGKPRYTGIIDLGCYEYCQGPGNASIAGNQNPCAGTAQTYTATSTGANYYTWTVPTGNGWNLVSGQGSASITVTVGSTNGTISVVPSNSCSAGTAGSLNITVAQYPANAGTITGPGSVCKGTAGIVYTVPIISNATGYVWTLPAGFTITNGNNTNSITVSVNNTAVSGNISVYGTNTCGNGAPSPNFAVTVNYVTANAGTDQTIPYGTPTQLNGTSSNGSGNYEWDWQPASKIQGANNIPNPTTIPLTSATQFVLTVNDITYGCDSQDTMWVFITGGPLADTATATPTEICLGGSSIIEAFPSGGSGTYTYSWTSNPPGYTSSQKQNTVFPIATTTYIVVVSDGVTSVTDSVTVTVNFVPAAPNQPVGPDSVNTNQNPTSTYTVDPVSGASSYDWMVDPPDAGTPTGSGTSVVVTWNTGYSGDAEISAQVINSCGPGPWSEPRSAWLFFYTSVPEVALGKIKVYPNPCDGHLSIDSEKLKISAVYIYDASGNKVLKQEKALKTHICLDVSDLSPGLYFLFISLESYALTTKVVVQ